MTPFETLTYIHLFFTVAAIFAGILAMIAIPKGNKLHKKAGLIYFYSFIGIVLFGLLMVFIKYRDLFLGVTIFNTYLIVMGYRAVRHKRLKANWVDWMMLTILFCGGLLFVFSAIKMYDIFFEPDYGWGVIRVFYAVFVFYIFIGDLRYFRNQSTDKKAWLYNHMEKMVITFTTLISGVLLRCSDYFFNKDFKWTFWITPYLVCLPLIAFWISKYKRKPLKQQK
jgi:uncharacterized membrane protein